MTNWLLFDFHLYYQEDDDGRLLALQISQDLLNKQKETFLDHFARLGIFHKVQNLVGDTAPEREEEDMACGDKANTVSTTSHWYRGVIRLHSDPGPTTYTVRMSSPHNS